MSKVPKMSLLISARARYAATGGQAMILHPLMIDSVEPAVLQTKLSNGAQPPSHRSRPAIGQTGPEVLKFRCAPEGRLLIMAVSTQHVFTVHTFRRGRHVTQHARYEY